MGAVPVLAVEHRGSYMQIGRAFDLLFGRVAAAGLARPGMRMFAMFFDDPTVVAEEALRAHACVAGAAPASADCDLMSFEIDGGMYAVLTHTGPYASMKSAYQWLFGQWLVDSGFAVRSGPMVEEYLNSPRETAPKDLRTRICLPVQAMDTDGVLAAGVG
jgi:AraC family transcriptional regulator